jgi:type VI secretion system protein
MTALRARITVIAVALLCGCGSPNGCRRTTALQKLCVTTDAGANGDSATRLDIVVAWDAATLAKLPSTAPAWFARRQAIRDGAPTLLSVISLELPPSLIVWPVALPPAVGKAVAVRAYADYRDPRGQHPIDLTGLETALLRLRAADVVLQPLPSPR